ncbi:MAG TPA: lysylphosphatidylglycerol synthase transmembrane domain-containing protein [Candidatus Limiplasma sp.]|nr:lysylphosphatidylglycerol synthase transmembrane domain-containing protein [Candidatus Limiplasma sp.]HRX08831.1 lysylphosphatidylglycerol synthase transmembrane domain-containing protein [Candidatus Limiplasma sp.]
MKRSILSFLFIAATLGLIVFIAFSNSDLTNAWEVLFTLKTQWLLCAFLGWFGYMLFDMLGLHYFLRKQKYPISIGFATYVTLLGFYYANITPGSSGGQPMQVYYLSKRKIPVPIATSALSIKFLSLQIMVVVMSTVLWIANSVYINAQLTPGAKWFVYIGYGINFLSIPLILLIALHRPLVQAIILFFVRVGAKLRIIKRPEERIVRLDAGMDMYHMSILRLMKYPKRIIGQMVFAALSLLSLMSIPLSVYRAFDLSGTHWYELLSLSFLLFISASYTPLPGASGAQEGGFLIFFAGAFTQGTIGLALLVWRFFSYYLFLLVGAVISIVGSFRGHRADKEEPSRAKSDTAQDSAEQ